MRSLGAALLSLLVLASCTSSSDGEPESGPVEQSDAYVELESELADLQEAAQEAEQRIEELEADNKELSADLEGLPSEDEVEALKEQIAELEAENRRIVAAFDEDIIAAREALASVAPGAGCALGSAAAVDDTITFSTDTLIDAAAESTTQAEQFRIAVDGFEELLETARTRFGECLDDQAAVLEAEALAAEAAALAGLLPYVCSFERYSGQYIRADGDGTRREDDVRDWIRAVYPDYSSLPSGWQASEATVAELERCAAEPRLLFPSGTWLVGDDIAAGTYRSVSAVTDTCYWSRNDANGNIRANQFTQSAAQIVINVSSSDYSVENEGCGIMVQGSLPAELSEADE